MNEDDWEAEIKIRRKGRIVMWERAFGATPAEALYAVHNDLERWAQEHPEQRDGHAEIAP